MSLSVQIDPDGPAMKYIEVEGVEYCNVHKGILVEGSDAVCQYEELGGDTPCVGIPLFTTEGGEIRHSVEEDKPSIPGPPERTGPDLSEPWKPTPDASITAAIQEAMGTASMCWENVAGAGVFQPDRALWVATGLHDYLIALTAEAQEAGREIIANLITHRDRLLHKQADAKIDRDALLKQVKELETETFKLKGDRAEWQTGIVVRDARIKELRAENHQLKDDALEARRAETVKGSPDPWMTIGNLIDRMEAIEMDQEEQ